MSDSEDRRRFEALRGCAIAAITAMLEPAQAYLGEGHTGQQAADLFCDAIALLINKLPGDRAQSVLRILSKIDGMEMEIMGSGALGPIPAPGGKPS